MFRIVNLDENLKSKRKSNGTGKFLELLDNIKDQDRYQKLICEIESLFQYKNAGYAGNSNDPWYNFRQAMLLDVTPFKGCLVRMLDKWSRIASLVRNPNNEKVGESLIDTLKDNAVYSLIAICLLEEEIKKEV